MSPQGRLTLQAGRPIMDALDIAAQTVYYTPYIGDTIPLWDGAKFVDSAFVDSGLPLAGTIAGKIYDIFAPAGGGAMILGAAWASLTARAHAVQMYRGVWCDESKNTLLGSVYITENGQTRFQVSPTPVLYGTANVLGLCNAYNRERVVAICRDLSSVWQNASSAGRFADNSDRWRVYWLDSLAQSVVKASYQVSVSGNGPLPAAATVDAVLDAAYPLHLSDGLEQAAINSTALGMGMEGNSFTQPLLGLHYYQAVEQGTEVSVTFYGNDFAALTVDVEL